MSTPLFFAAWLPAAALLVGCAPTRSSAPTFVDADAWCDDAGEWWTFWADVEHPDGPRAVEWVVLEIALELGNGELDSVYVAELEYQTEGEWAGSLEDGITALACDAPEPYVYLFTAQDIDGAQGYFDFYESLEE